MCTTEELIELFNEKRFEIDRFRDTVEKYFLSNPKLMANGRNLIHSTKSRMKDENHLREKIERKRRDGRDIRRDHFFEQITDLAGVRLLLLYQEDFRQIHQAIVQKVFEDQDWSFAEDPIAYTWDPEHQAYFEQFQISPRVKESNYTSVHYVVKSNSRNPVYCEIQVRTLFEEIWGEVDHHLNYPQSCGSAAITEQIKVLSKIVGAGSRLLDAIHRSSDNGGALTPPSPKSP